MSIKTCNRIADGKIGTAIQKITNKTAEETIIKRPKTKIALANQPVKETLILIKLQ
ncbi:hypothetical protein [Mucilaginibacter xinganensis]|uniref:Uncharacterized protein n=1 Tax=Mucilaginibacter xinganensis TaxID=1234841 RepID=A0A223NZJ7_9SPHI|nr:hypothetical protein [Mucilaginibacter xinganensis]ASU35293.1 hypothetical protein MuYL_3408 [Mucilaginibacter xinganensis]